MTANMTVSVSLQQEKLFDNGKCLLAFTSSRWIFNTFFLLHMHVVEFEQ